jgi:hypothetical protein
VAGIGREATAVAGSQFASTMASRTQRGREDERERVHSQMNGLVLEKVVALGTCHETVQIIRAQVQKQSPK